MLFNDYSVCVSNCSCALDFISSNCSLSLILDTFANSDVAFPVPAGINLPTITFSLRPASLSIFPWTAASVKTLVVSWNDAAEINESVWRLALVIPKSIGLDLIIFFSQILALYSFY